MLRRLLPRRCRSRCRRQGMEPCIVHGGRAGANPATTCARRGAPDAADMYGRGGGRRQAFELSLACVLYHRSIMWTVIKVTVPQDALYLLVVVPKVRKNTY